MVQFKELDPLLHSQLRLAIISLLMGVERAEFTWIREQTGSTAGNLSIQIGKLKEAGYVEVLKGFSNNYPQTLVRITALGRRRFAEYVEAIQNYLKT